MADRMQLYNYLLEMAVNLRISGEPDLGQLLNETARCILLEREKAGAHALRIASDAKDR